MVAAREYRVLVHGFTQALLERDLPRALLTDDRKAMLAGEFREAAACLGIVHRTTPAHSPYQNGKQEKFWAHVEERLMAMPEGVTDLSLALSDRNTEACVQTESHRKPHGKKGQLPMSASWLARTSRARARRGRILPAHLRSVSQTCNARATVCSRCSGSVTRNPTATATHAGSRCTRQEERGRESFLRIPFRLPTRSTLRGGRP